MPGKQTLNVSGVGTEKLRDLRHQPFPEMSLLRVIGGEPHHDRNWAVGLLVHLASDAVEQDGLARASGPFDQPAVARGAAQRVGEGLGGQWIARAFDLDRDHAA